MCACMYVCCMYVPGARAHVCDREERRERAVRGEPNAGNPYAARNARKQRACGVSSRVLCQTECGSSELAEDGHGFCWRLWAVQVLCLLCGGGEEHHLGCHGLDVLHSTNTRWSACTLAWRARSALTPRTGGSALGTGFTRETTTRRTFTFRLGN